MQIFDFFDKKCFGNNNCWNQVRAKCLIAKECRVKALTIKKINSIKRV